MKQQVDFVYDFESDPSDEIKHWLFLESVRIEQDKQELNEMRKQLEEEKKSFEKLKKEQSAIMEARSKKLAREKELFEKQWKVLERELKRIAKDNERIENEKAYLEREKINFRKALKNNDSKTAETTECRITGFFTGTTGLVSVRKRYKELLKIFHPDNINGDNSIITQINKEYEELKKRYEN